MGDTFVGSEEGKETLLISSLIYRNLLLEEIMSIKWINCVANDTGFGHLNDERIVGGELGVVLKESEEGEDDESQKQV